MKKYIYILLIFNLLSCSSSIDITQKQKYSEFKIVNTPLIVENDTVYINELRFFKTQSALDGMKLMYRNYGKWNEKIAGKYQKNINRIIWKNIKLIDGEDMTFMVIADGSESNHGYFASLMVLDSDKKDCFNLENPYREKLTDLFVDKMNRIGKNSSVYRLFR